ncbi:MAG TPA: ArsR family transcriptional regulator [Candidatus Thermoplasmatota archaeon]|nr:ArsR family transcriptional regulator [Candidatus Thermoplasmatota archaeon]
MRRETTLTLDERDEEMADLFATLGMPRNLAKTLVFLAQVREAVSTEIEHGAGLRQPEVSVAMQALRDHAWVEKRDLKKEGKGRPVHCYRLLVKLEDVVADIERTKRAEAERTFNAIARLRTLAAETGRAATPP